VNYTLSGARYHSCCEVVYVLLLPAVVTYIVKRKYIRVYRSSVCLHGLPTITKLEHM